MIFSNPGANERMRIDASGNVSIGTTTGYAGYGSGRGLTLSNQSSLIFQNASNTWNSTTAGGAVTYFSDNNMYIDAKDSGSNVIFRVNGATERARITSAGDVGIGTVSPQQTAAGRTVVGVNGSSSSLINIGSGGNFGSYWFWDGTTATLAANNTLSLLAGASPILFSNSGVERARIDASGNLLVGTTDASITSGTGVKIRPGANGSVANVDSRSDNTSVGYAQYSTGAGAYRFYVGWGGTIFATNTSISAISDIRFKENIRDIDAGLDAILALKPRRFDWKEGKGKDVKDDMGFIAQEVEEVLPELIDGWMPGDGEPDDLKSVKASDLIPVLVKAIQELTARVAQLEGN